VSVFVEGLDLKFWVWLSFVAGLPEYHPIHACASFVPYCTVQDFLVGGPGVEPGLQDYALLAPVAWSVGLYHHPAFINVAVGKTHCKLGRWVPGV
jgi:hypothetical protein